METVERVIAILGIIVGVLWSLWVLFAINWASGQNDTTFFEELIRDPDSLLLLLPGLALIAFPVWYLLRLKKQKKEVE